MPSLLSLSLMLAVPALAFAEKYTSVNLGNSNGDNLAWIAGQNPCDAVIITYPSDSPCGEFTLKTGTFKLSQCGVSNLEVDYSNGAHMSTCSQTSYSKSCGGHELYQDWAC